MKYAALFGAIMVTPLGNAFAQGFSWEPVAPPVYSPSVVKPIDPPKIEAPKQIVPGHKSTYGYVPSYKSDGPTVPPLAPGEKSTGWVPGYHDEKGAWVPGHPR
jgi:hypothetical protein